MKINYLKYGLWFIGFIGVLSFSYPALINEINQGNEKFLSMGILNKYNETRDYFDYPDGVLINSTLRWNILLKNLGQSELILIKTKIANEESDLPQKKLCEQSRSPVLYQIYRVLGRETEISIPFEWAIQKINPTTMQITVNNRIYQYNISYDVDNTYFMIFELWVYDPGLKDFTFQWTSRSEPQCIWNHIKFSIRES